MSETLVLDTHVLVWLLEGDKRLGRNAREMAETALQPDNLMVSAISFWEVAMLAQRRRLVLVQPAAIWRQKVLQLGIVEVPVSGDIGILAGEIDGLAEDPADRIITATAIVRDSTLITADKRILQWSGAVQRHDARS